MNAKLLDIERRYGREFAKQAAKAQLIERVCDADDVTAWRIDAPAAPPPRVAADDDSPRARAWRGMIAYNRNREDASPTSSAAESRRRMVAWNRNGGR
jgi:hypothetical protein